jgi:hypothetical protein
MTFPLYSVIFSLTNKSTEHNTGNRITLSLLFFKTIKELFCFLLIRRSILVHYQVAAWQFLIYRRFCYGSIRTLKIDFRLVMNEFREGNVFPLPWEGIPPAGLRVSAFISSSAQKNSMPVFLIPCRGHFLPVLFHMQRALPRLPGLVSGEHHGQLC